MRVPIVTIALAEVLPGAIVVAQEGVPKLQIRIKQRGQAFIP
jgi:hypothetical protein